MNRLSRKRFLKKPRKRFTGKTIGDFLFTVPAHQHHGHARVRFSQFGESLLAVQLRHREVEQHTGDLGRVPVEERHRFAPIGGFDHGKTE